MPSRTDRRLPRGLPGGHGHTWAQKRLKVSKERREVAEVARAVGRSAPALRAILGYNGRAPQPPGLVLLWRLVAYFDEERSDELMQSPDEQVVDALEKLITEIGPERLLYLSQLDPDAARSLIDRHGRRRQTRLS